MKKTIKLIDLYNKIANGEELPKKIKYKDLVYEIKYIGEDIDYIVDEKWSYNNQIKSGIPLLDAFPSNTLNDFIYYTSALNDEIEIIDEEPKKIELLEGVMYEDDDVQIERLPNLQEIKNKINEIIDYINRGNVDE